MNKQNKRKLYSSSSSLLTTWVQTNISFIMYTESHVMTIKNIK